MSLSGVKKNNVNLKEEIYHDIIVKGFNVLKDHCQACDIEVIVIIKVGLTFLIPCHNPSCIFINIF